MEEKDETKLRRDLALTAAHARHLHEEIEQLREELAEKDKDFELFRDSVIKPVLAHVYSDEERNRLLEIEDRYNSIKQMHDDFCVEQGATPTFRGDTCWFCEEERLDRED